MIQPLVDAAVARLRAELPGLGAPERRVVAGPVAEPGAAELPLIALSAGRFEIGRDAREARAAEPRPQPAQERLLLEPGRREPYPLARTPLQGTTRGRLVLAEGTPAERRELLQEGKDFAIDYRAGTLSLRTDLAARITEHAHRVTAQIQARAGHAVNPDSPQEVSALLFEELRLPPPGEKGASGYYSTARPVLEALADQHPVIPLVLTYRTLNGGATATLLLDYSFAGIFTVRDFEQALRLEVYAADAGQAEQWASLAAGVLLTAHGALLAAGRREYLSGGAVSTEHQVLRMELAEGTPGAFAGGARVELSFRVGGQVKLFRAPDGGTGTIEYIYSPGSTAPGPVSIDASLG